MAHGDQGTKTIPAQLKYWANIDPEKPAFIFVGEKDTQTFSRRGIYSYAGKMASFLKRVGAKKGDVIAVSMCRGLNCPDRLICELGVQMAGCTSIEANTVFKTENALADHIAGSNAKILVVDHDSFSTGSLTSCVPRKYGFDVSLPGVPSLKHVISVPNLKEIVLKEDNLFMENVDPLDIAVLGTTSGTTSPIKLVPQSQQFLVDSGHLVCQALGDISDTQYYNDASINWVTGYPSCYLAKGVTRVLRNHRAETLPAPEDVFKPETKYVGFLSTEEVHELYLKSKGEMSWKPVLEKLIVGGQPISKTLIKQALVVAKTVVIIYASTETAPMAYYRVDDACDYEDFCVGNEFQDVKIKILDDKKQEVAIRQRGIIFIKRPILTGGYLNADGILTRERFTDEGWFVTDDVGYRDESRKLFVTGRGSDVIMNGELIVYPQHFESLLAECPAINDSVLVGIPDPITHHEMCAVIKPQLGFDDPIQDVKAFLNDKIEFAGEQEIAYNLIPKYFVLCDSIFRNKNGKIMRKKVTEFAKEKLRINGEH